MTQANMPKSNPSEPHPLVRIANLEAKVAQLEQRLAKLETLQAPPASPALIASFLLEKGSADSNLFEIVSIDTRTIEANDSWSKVAWKLVLKSLADTTMVFHASIEFLDKDGFLVDDTLEPNLLLSARNEQTYTGYTLIDASLIGSVALVRAQVKLS